MSKNVPMTANVAPVPQAANSLFFDVQKFEHGWRVSQMFASSDMVPDHFREKPANVMIALNLSDRLGLDPFMTMQNMYVVHGRPGVSGQLAIALINKSGRFEPLRFRFSGENNTRQCTAYAKDKITGEELSQTVTWAMVEAEGWAKKSGSKWKTMPDIMFQYRSAMFFARMYCPEALMGLRTEDELIDITPAPMKDITPRNEAEAKMIAEDDAFGAKLDRFDEKVRAMKNSAHVSDFVEALARQNKCTADDIMINAIDDFDSFYKVFVQWRDKHYPQETPARSPELQAKIEELKDAVKIDPGIAKKVFEFHYISGPEAVQDIETADKILKRFGELLDSQA